MLDKNTPPPEVPAKRFVPLTANERTVEKDKPLFTAVQELPLLVDKNTPPSEVPTKRFVPLATIERTSVFVKPLFLEIQELPLLVDKNTPPPKCVTAKRFVPFEHKDLMYPPPGPLVCVHWAFVVKVTESNTRKSNSFFMGVGFLSLGSYKL